MHGSRCSHSADTEPKSSPLHPRPGHLKLSKVPGSAAWCRGDRGGESPSPTCPAALEQSPLGLVLCIIFKRAKGSGMQSAAQDVPGDPASWVCAIPGGLPTPSPSMPWALPESEHLCLESPNLLVSLRSPTSKDTAVWQRVTPSRTAGRGRGAPRGSLALTCALPCPGWTRMYRGAQGMLGLIPSLSPAAA